MQVPVQNFDLCRPTHYTKVFRIAYLTSHQRAISAGQYARNHHGKSSSQEYLYLLTKVSVLHSTSSRATCERNWNILIFESSLLRFNSPSDQVFYLCDPEDQWNKSKFSPHVSSLSLYAIGLLHLITCAITRRVSPALSIDGSSKCCTSFRARFSSRHRLNSQFKRVLRPTEPSSIAAPHCVHVMAVDAECVVDFVVKFSWPIRLALWLHLHLITCVVSHGATTRRSRDLILNANFKRGLDYFRNFEAFLSALRTFLCTPL